MAFSYASDVERLALALIPKHHPHLLGVEVRYLFDDRPLKRRKHRILGYVRKIIGVQALLAAKNAEYPQDFFAMIISLPAWESLSEEGKVILVDHELCHCQIEDDRLVLRDHDVQEFVDIVQRYGISSATLGPLAPFLAEQIELFAT